MSVAEQAYQAVRAQRVLSDRAVAIMLMATAVAALFACYVLSLPFWAADVLCIGLPCVFLILASHRARTALEAKFIVKYVLFGIVFFDYLGIQHNAWTGPSAFPLLPGEVPVEHVVWCTFMIVLSLCVNQHFFATTTTTPPVTRNRVIIRMMLLGGISFALVEPLHPLIEDYVYLKIGLVLYPVVFVLALRTNPMLRRELLLTLVVFTAFNLGFEILAVHNGYWSFTGAYVGWASVAGQRFPIEELVFTVFLLAPAIVATHALRANWQASKRRSRLRAKVTPYLELGKLRVVELGMGVPLAWSLVTTDALETRTIALSALALVIVLSSSSAALAFDDVAGFRDAADVINHPPSGHRMGVKKPLVMGMMTERQAVRFAQAMCAVAAASAVFGIVLSPPTQWWMILVGCGVIVGVVNYSIGARFSYKGGHELVTFVGLAASVALPYILITSEISVQTALQATLVGLWMLHISLFSNLADRHGDRTVNRRTAAVSRSVRANALLVVALVCVAWAVAAGGAAIGVFSPWMLVALIPVAVLQARQLHAGLRQRRWLAARARGFWTFRAAVGALFVTNLVFSASA